MKLPKFEDFLVENGCIAYSEIEEQMGKVEFKRFKKWMIGQTVSFDGVYVCDLERYLNQRSRGIKKPSIVD